MRVVECEYQYFLLTIKSLIPSDATLDKVSELTATIASQSFFKRPKKRLVIISFCAEEEQERDVVICGVTRRIKDT